VQARAAAASKNALARNRRGAQASLPTKAAPPVKRRFESSLAHRLLPIAPRDYAPNAQSELGAREAGQSRHVRQTPVHLRSGPGGAFTPAVPPALPSRRLAASCIYGATVALVDKQIHPEDARRIERAMVEQYERRRGITGRAS
jgi:hypothetical protein